jgi:hypothetical protein
VLPVVKVVPEPVVPDCEVVSSLEVVPLPVVGAEAVELSLVLEMPEIGPAVVPMDVSLALCANAGSSGITIATAKMTKKTAQLVMARRKYSLYSPLPPALAWRTNMSGVMTIGFGYYGFDPAPI